MFTDGGNLCSWAENVLLDFKNSGSLTVLITCARDGSVTWTHCRSLHFRSSFSEPGLHLGVLWKMQDYIWVSCGKCAQTFAIQWEDVPSGGTSFIYWLTGKGDSDIQKIWKREEYFYAFYGLNYYRFHGKSIFSGNFSGYIQWRLNYIEAFALTMTAMLFLRVSEASELSMNSWKSITFLGNLCAQSETQKFAAIVESRDLASVLRNLDLQRTSRIHALNT